VQITKQHVATQGIIFPIVMRSISVACHFYYCADNFTASEPLRGWVVGEAREWCIWHLYLDTSLQSAPNILVKCASMTVYFRECRLW